MVGQFHVLKNINLTVQPGERIVYVALQVPVNQQPFVVLIIWRTSTGTDRGRWHRT